MKFFWAHNLVFLNYAEHLPASTSRRGNLESRIPCDAAAGREPRMEEKSLAVSVTPSADDVGEAARKAVDLAYHLKRAEELARELSQASVGVEISLSPPR